MRALATYRDSDLFSKSEMLVLDLAEQMTRAPVAISDEFYKELQAFFDASQIVELTAAIAWKNYRSRFNHALGIQSHGFSEGQYCVIPETARTAGN